MIAAFRYKLAHVTRMVKQIHMKAWMAGKTAVRSTWRPMKTRARRIGKTVNEKVSCSAL
jgi:hypothetical protein